MFQLRERSLSRELEELSAMDPLNFPVGGQGSLLPKSYGSGGARSLSLSRQSSLPGGAASRAGGFWRKDIFVH